MRPRAWEAGQRLEFELRSKRPQTEGGRNRHGVVLIKTLRSSRRAILTATEPQTCWISFFNTNPQSDEIVAMGELLSEELESGALGLSTGLEYDPGIYSTTSEVVALARITAEHGKRYSSHMRSEDRNLFDAIEETISIARATGIPVHISHIKLAMKSLWGRASEVLLLLDQAREEGLEVTADLYPYEYWQSTMTVLFPDRSFTREAATFALQELAPPEGMLIDRYEPNRSYEGQTLAEISDLRKSDPVTTYLDLIAESQAAEEAGSGGGERGK